MKGFEFRYALREMFHLRRLFLLLFLNLTLGLLSYLTLSTFQSGLRGVLLGKAKETMAADISLSVRRVFTADEQESIKGLLPEGSEVGRVQDLVSMAVFNDQSRLVQLRAIDESFPFYGALKLQSGRVITKDSDKSLLLENAIWVYPEILVQLGAKVGDRLELGGDTFVIDDVILDDPTQTFSFGGLAPRIYTSPESLVKAGVVRLGTTLTESFLIRLKEGSPEQVEEAKNKILTGIKDPTISIQSYQESNEQTSRFLRQLFDYLGLGALVGVSLSAFGLVALVQSWLNQKVRSYAIASAVGLTGRQIRRIFLMQLGMVGFATWVVSAVLASLGLPWVQAFASQYVKIPFEPVVPWLSLLQGAALVLLGSFALTIPFLLALTRVPLQRLFSEGTQFTLQLSWREVALWGPAIIGFWALSVIEVNSYRLGTGFVLSVVLIYGFLAVWGHLLFRLLRPAPSLAWESRQAFIYLQRKPVLLITFVALSLGTFLTVLVPQVRSGLKAELNPEANKDRPTLFLFDIQDDQLEPLRTFVREKGFELRNESPLIRSRILKVNGQDYERLVLGEGFQTREEENEARFRNRGINLSFRSSLFTSEKLREGRPFSATQDPNKPVELSVEFRYAERMGFKVGDLILADIQGVEIEGEVISLREVDWASFQPNFFILVHPDSLKEAPKIWLANVKTDLPGRLDLQTSVAREFPNVSTVDVVRLLDKLQELTDQMTLALEAMAWLTTLSGLMVLVALLIRQLSLQSWDANLYRLLGASGGSLTRLYLVQMGALVLLSLATGSVLALGMTWVAAWVLFDGVHGFDLTSLLIAMGLILSVGGLLAWTFAQRLSKANPSRLLQEVRI